MAGPPSAPVAGGLASLLAAAGSTPPSYQVVQPVVMSSQQDARTMAYLQHSVCPFSLKSRSTMSQLLLLFAVLVADGANCSG